MKFRKKPVIIEAIQFTEETKTKAFNFINGECKAIRNNEGVLTLEIQTLEGVMIATPNDWIIRGIQGEYYPCKPDIFDETYEAVIEPEDENEKLG